MRQMWILHAIYFIFFFTVFRALKSLEFSSSSQDGFKNLMVTDRFKAMSAICIVFKEVPSVMWRENEFRFYFGYFCKNVSFLKCPWQELYWSGAFGDVLITVLKLYFFLMKTKRQREIHLAGKTFWNYSIFHNWTFTLFSRTTAVREKKSNKKFQKP